MDEKQTHWPVCPAPNAFGIPSPIWLHDEWNELEDFDTTFGELSKEEIIYLSDFQSRQKVYVRKSYSADSLLARRRGVEWLQTALKCGDSKWNV